MNIFRTAAFRIPALALALPLAALVFAGCDVGSTDSTAAVVSDDDGTIYNFAGFYMHPDTDGTNIVPLVTGALLPGLKGTLLLHLINDACVVALVVWFWMPIVTRLFAGWLKKA